MSLEAIFFLLGVLTEATVLGLLLFRRVYRSFPVFSAYLAWSLINDVGEYLLLRRFPGHARQIYLAGAIIDAAFVFGVLIEISMSVLKPIRASLPRWTIVAVAILIAVVCAAIWPFSTPPGANPLDHSFQIIVQMRLTASVVRTLFFLALAGFSQLLSLGWKDRELQVATGFGVYSLISLLAALLHGSIAPSLEQFRLLDEIVAASFICSMVYWVISFAQKVPERRKFTPQMQNFLVALAGSARTTRIALNESTKRDSTRQSR